MASGDLLLGNQAISQPGHRDANYGNSPLALNLGQAGDDQHGPRGYALWNVMEREMRIDYLNSVGEEYWQRNRWFQNEIIRGWCKNNDPRLSAHVEVVWDAERAVSLWTLAWKAIDTPTWAKYNTTIGTGAIYGQTGKNDFFLFEIPMIIFLRTFCINENQLESISGVGSHLTRFFERGVIKLLFSLIGIVAVVAVILLQIISHKQSTSFLSGLGLFGPIIVSAFGGILYFSSFVWTPRCKSYKCNSCCDSLAKFLCCWGNPFYICDEASCPLQPSGCCCECWWIEQL